MNLKNFLFVHFLTKKVNKMIGSESLGFVKMYTEILSNEVNAGKWNLHRLFATKKQAGLLCKSAQNLDKSQMIWAKTRACR